MSETSGRKSRIESAYRVRIPGVLLSKESRDDAWHQFVMSPADLMELYTSIRVELGLANDVERDRARR